MIDVYNKCTDSVSSRRISKIIPETVNNNQTNGLKQMKICCVPDS